MKDDELKLEWVQKAIETGSVPCTAENQKELRRLELHGLLFGCHFPAVSHYYPSAKGHKWYREQLIEKEESNG